MSGAARVEMDQEEGAIRFPVNCEGIESKALYKTRKFTEILYPAEFQDTNTQDIRHP